MMNEKPTLKSLLETSAGKKLLLLGKEQIFTQKEIARFLKRFKVTPVKYLEEGVVGVIENHRLNPVEEDISNEAYEQKLPIYKLSVFEQLLSEEIDDDALLMAIKLGNDQERIVRLLGNEHLSNALFVSLLKLYTFHTEEEDNRQDRDVIMFTLRRYIDIKPNEEDLLYSYLTLRRLATEATDPELLKALLYFPNFEFLIRGREKVTLQKTIARNPFIDEETVRKLLATRKVAVARALAGNSVISNEVQKYLLSQDDEAIDMALAVNNTIDKTIFDALLTRGNEAVSLLLIHQPIDASRFEKVRKSGIDAEQYALLGANEMLDTDVIESLAAMENKALWQMLAGNKTIPVQVLASLYEKGGREVYLALAKNPAVPEAILESLYERAADDTEMLAALAHNPSLPDAKLRALFERDNFEINRGLATNAALPPELLDVLKIDTRLQNELAQNEQLAKSYEAVLKQNKAMMNV